MSTASELPSCGVNDNEDDSLMVLNKRVTKVMKRCYKCAPEKSDEQAKPVIHFRNEPLCKEDYIDLLRKKFKNHLSKCRSPTKPNKEMEHIIVGVSGGVCSTTLLELIYQCSTASKKSKLFFEPHCVFIDESSIYQNYRKDEIVEYLKGITSSFGVGLDIVPIENIFGDSEESREKRVGLLTQSLQSLSSQTSREDLVGYFKEQLLRKKAEFYKSHRIILGSTSIHLASRVFSSASKGRGFTLPLETSGLNDNPTDSVIIHYPMKDFLLKEIYIYHYHLLPSAPHPFTTYNRNIKASLNTLCEDFVHTLQDISNQTIYTLLRSIEKLVTPVTDKNIFCCLCHSSLTSEECSKINQFKKSSNNNNSSSCCDSNNNNSTCCSTKEANCCSSGQSNSNQLLNPGVLCYSCKILYGEFKPNTATPLPGYVYENAKTMLTTAQLKNEIKDFLLESDDE